MSRFDFNAFGEAQGAYPGDLIHNWGAVLVEPPDIATLRKRAGQRLVRLGDLAPARSGIPTRVVHYFMVVEIEDAEALRAAGIRTGNDRRRLALIEDGRGGRHIIERKVLRPTVRRPGILDGRIKVDESAVGHHRIFYTHLERAELEDQRLSYTLDYIRYGETTDFPARENSRRLGGVPAQRPNVKNRRVWFHLPRIDEGAGRVCWIKGRGYSHYAPVLDEGVLAPDNFLISSPPDGLPRPEAFGAVANLTFTHLMAEIFGRRSGGDGVLHTYIRELNRLPILDPRQLSADETDDLLEAFEEIASRSVLNISEELRQEDRQKFDGLAMRLLFGPEDGPDAAVAVTRAIRQLVGEREARSTSGREQVKQATRRTVFNVGDYAARALKDVGEAPDPMVDASWEHEMQLIIDVPAHSTKGSLSAGRSLFDLDNVVVGDQVVSTPSPAHAQFLTEVLRRRSDTAGNVVLPIDDGVMSRNLDLVRGRWDVWCGEMSSYVHKMLPGRTKQSQRVDVLREVERMQGIWPGSLVEAGVGT